MSAEPPALPRAHDDDDDDVAWALQTAGVQWERGAAPDAIVWLKRAAEAAAEAGEFGRSADIQRRANEIDRYLKLRVTFPLQQADDDDGVDSLLATDHPDIEAGVLAEPSPSMVDALEAEARELEGGGGVLVEEAPVQDLGDLEDVEDIEAIDVDEFEEERRLDGYREELLDETTAARSEVSRAYVEQLREQTRPSSPPPGRVVAPLPSSRPPKGALTPRVATLPGGSSAPPRESVRPPKPGSRAASTPAAAPRERRRSQNATPAVPAPVQYNLPPPPIPRFPTPAPSRAPLPEVSEPRSAFPSEPATLPASERPVIPIVELPRQRAESLPEVSVTDLDMPAEPPTSAYASRNAVRQPSDAYASRLVHEPSGAPLAAEPSETSVAVREALEASVALPPAESSVPPRGAPREAPVSVAAPAELDAAVDALSETPPPPPVLELALLAACRGLEDLPPETQEELAARARVETLAPDQEVSGFGLALVTRGHVVVMPTIAEGACGYAARGEPVFSRGTLSEGVPLRVVALAEGAEVAVWRPEHFEHVLETCPWVADELRAVADRFQALAGAAMGPLGDRLDDNMRAMLTDRCTLRVLLAGEVLLEEGKPPAGLFILGGGGLEAVSGGAVVQEFVPGDLPFASAVLTHEKAAATVRAAATGALVLHADRMATHELLVSVPPLLELLSMV